MNPILKQVEASQLRSEPSLTSTSVTPLPSPCRIKEGDKERIQTFTGTVISKKAGHGDVNAAFTVRRIVDGIGVERVFPVHSPKVLSVKVTRQGRVRRAKLYYLRDRVGKATKVKEKRVVRH